jgi:hypothetical protein
MKYLKMLIHKKKRAKNFILHFLCLKISSFFFFFSFKCLTGQIEKMSRTDEMYRDRDGFDLLHPGE